MTGLTDGQLTELVARVCEAGGQFSSRGRPYVLGLFGSVAMVVALMRKNITQEFAGAIFGVSQPTVSRRWGLLRPLIGQVLAEFVPDPAQVIGKGTVLVDGTVCPTWDWKAIPDLFSAKAGYPGMTIQVAASLDGRLAAIGATLVPGARHDAYAASGLARSWATSTPPPTSATSASTASIPCPSANFPALTSIPPKPNSTPPCPKFEPPSNTPSRTSKRGASSVKKAAAIAHPSANTPACAQSRHRTTFLQHL
jgi:hypothetical protein